VRGGGRPPLPQPETPLWPAAFDEVVAVGALDVSNGHPGRIADFTPHATRHDSDGGTWLEMLPWITLLAPGARVPGLYLEGNVSAFDKKGNTAVKYFEGWARWSGTSFAAGTVSGALAALTTPGTRSAHEALRLLLDSAETRESFGIRGVT
jgi:membrane-anchored mycosin MYCP